MSCPPLTPLLVSPGVCVSACPSGYTQSTETIYECVSTLPCPVDFIVVGDSNTECTKPAPTIILQNESCAEGFDEWEANKCYKSCPSGFVDNGLSCLKHTLTRDAVTLTKECSNIFYYSPYEGAPCTFSTIGIWIITLCLIGGAWLIYVGYKFYQRASLEAKLKLTANEHLLQQINNYFLTN